MDGRRTELLVGVPLLFLLSVLLLEELGDLLLLDGEYGNHFVVASIDGHLQSGFAFRIALVQVRRVNGQRISGSIPQQLYDNVRKASVGSKVQRLPTKDVALVHLGPCFKEFQRASSLP